MNEAGNSACDWLTYYSPPIAGSLTIHNKPRLNKRGAQHQPEVQYRNVCLIAMDSMKMELPAFGEHVFQADYIQKKRHRRVSIEQNIVPLLSVAVRCQSFVYKNIILCAET